MAAITIEAVTHLLKFSLLYFLLNKPRNVHLTDYTGRLFGYFKANLFLLLLSWTMVGLLSLFLAPWQTGLAVAPPLFFLGYHFNKKIIIQKR
jgi:hypothetical protein